MNNGKRRILVISVHLTRDRDKRPTNDFMQPMAGLHVASMIDRRHYDVTLYSEMYSGPMDVREVLARKPHYDIVVLSAALQKDFDRMRQLSYCFRRLGAVVVAGGSFCTLYPEFASQFFDVVCSGGVENMLDVMADYESGALRSIYRRPQSRIANVPIDYTLLREAGLSLPLHHVEASRGCSFQCDFCAIPAERAGHSVYSVENVAENVERSIAAAPLLSARRLYPIVWFIDNNFSNNEEHLRAVCDYMRRSRRVRCWGALVTQNTLRRPDIMRTLAESRCRLVFTGLESLDLEFLRRHNKKQNTQSGVLEQVREAHKLGIIVAYGYLFDPRTTTVAAMTEEVVTLGRTPHLSFPDFFSFVSPLLGTRMFSECVEKGELLPNVLLRDLEGSTVTTRSLDPIGALSNFARKVLLEPASLVSRRDMTRKMLHIMGDFKHPLMWYVTWKNNMRHYANAPRDGHQARPMRSYIAGLDALDPQYYELPDDLTHSDWSRYFEPLRVTEADGQLAQWLRREEIPTAAVRQLTSIAAAPPKPLEIRTSPRSAVLPPAHGELPPSRTPRPSP